MAKTARVDFLRAVLSFHMSAWLLSRIASRYFPQRSNESAPPCVMNSPLPQSISRAKCGGCLLYSFGYLSLCGGDDIFAGNIFQLFAVSFGSYHHNVPAHPNASVSSCAAARQKSGRSAPALYLFRKRIVDSQLRYAAQRIVVPAGGFAQPFPAAVFVARED